MRLGPSFSPPSKAARNELGTVLRQPDPILHIRVRPAHVERQRDPRTSTARPQPSLHLVDAIARPQGPQHTLQVSVGLLQFHDHQLFLQEHAIQRWLRTLAEQLAEQTEGEALALHERKIAELAITVRHLESQLPGREAALESSGEGRKMSETQLRLAALCIELLHTRRLRDEQECAERLLARRMLVLWQDLKALRHQQGFQATRARLQVTR